MTRAKVESSADQNCRRHKNREVCDIDNTVEFVNQARKKKKKKEIDDADVDKTFKTDTDLKEKKLRFSIEGKELPKGSDETVEKVGSEKKKVRKPRWSEERKLEERKRKAEEPLARDVEAAPPKKKNRSKKTKIKIAIDESSSALSTSSLQYLQHWQYDRSSWKFSKMKQTWLLKHTFDLKKIPKSLFPVLLDYISSCKGGARLKTYEAAAKIIQKLEEKVSLEESEHDEERDIMKCLEGEESEEDKEEIHQRARSIMQQLSDCT